MPVENYQYKTVSDLEMRTGVPDQFFKSGYQHIVNQLELTSQLENKETPQVLYIDGITSAGKTTLLNEMAKANPEALYIPEFYREQDPPVQYRNINPQMPIEQQLRTEFWFYSQYLQKNNDIKQSSGKVIVDRGLLGLFCYSNLLSKQQEVSSRIMLQALQHDWVPGAYVFLTARPEVIKQRLLTRPDSARITETDWENGMGNFIEILHNSVEKVTQEAGISLIDTSDRTPQEVMNEVQQIYTNFYNN